MLILCYVIIKTLVFEILNHAETVNNMFPKTSAIEKRYFPLFGYTFIVLSTEYLYERFMGQLSEVYSGKDEGQVK